MKPQYTATRIKQAPRPVPSAARAANAITTTTGMATGEPAIFGEEIVRLGPSRGPVRRRQGTARGVAWLVRENPTYTINGRHDNELQFPPAWGRTGRMPRRSRE